VDALRRIRPRNASSGRSARRVRIDDYEDQHVKLGGAAGRLSSALDQLRSGVPLNWGQVEDDPELATLARLQQAGQECRLLPISEPSPAQKAELIRQLSSNLRAPVLKQQKAAPKSLAGFSENVPILTQVEDNVSVGVNWPIAILRGAVGLVVVALVVWGVSSLLRAGATPSYGWIQAMRDGQPVTHMQHVLNKEVPLCETARAQNPLRPGFFVPVESLRDAQSYVDYNIPLLPEGITIPTTYTFRLSLASVDPCDGNTLKGSDEGALVALQYDSNELVVDPNGKTNAFGKSVTNKTVSTSLSLFASSAQPAFLDVSSGNWKDVRVGSAHGVYWRGGPYRDPAGIQWIGDVSVLVIEHEDTVVTLVGSATEGITEDMLTEVARNIAW
jgi:hypothetical protein